MKYSFVRPPTGPPKPIIPFSFAQRPRLKLLGLVDSGSQGVRLDAQFATELNVDLTGVPERWLIVAGRHYMERPTTVPLRIGTRGYTWDAEVSFVQDWGHSFQLLGVRGFFDQFVVRIDAQKEFVALNPHKV